MPKNRVTEILEQLASNKGIAVIHGDLQYPIDGLFRTRKNKAPEIILGNRLSGDRLNKVFAHELGHSQLHIGEGDLLFCKDKAKVLKAEKQADAFAEILIKGIELALLESEVMV